MEGEEGGWHSKEADYGGSIGEYPEEGGAHNRQSGQGREGGLKTKLQILRPVEAKCQQEGEGHRFIP